MTSLVTWLPRRLGVLVLDTLFGPPDLDDYVSRTAPSSPPPTIFD